MSHLPSGPNVLGVTTNIDEALDMQVPVHADFLMLPTNADQTRTHQSLDYLTQLAYEHEKYITSAPLPNAFTAAAAAASHNHDLLDFETARQLVHYISCPPPRLRHIKEALSERKPTALGGSDGIEKTDAASGSIGAKRPRGSPTAATPSDPCTTAASMESSGASETKSQDTDSSLLNNTTDAATEGMDVDKEVVPKIRFQKVIFETSILEPEAAVYLKSRIGAKFIVYVHPPIPGEPAPYTLSTEDLWLHFCARVANFPARYVVYAALRDRGLIVRDGHAFGSDYVLYPRGPGMGHATDTVIVMPLRVVSLESERKAESGHSSGQIFDQVYDGDSVDSSVDVSEEDGETVAAREEQQTVGHIAAKNADAVVKASSQPPEEETSGEVPSAQGQELSGSVQPSAMAPTILCIPKWAPTVLGTWGEVHAHGRVIGAAKKKMIAATVTLYLPREEFSSGNAVGSMEQYNEYGQLVYSPWIANYLSSPECIPTLSQHIHFLNYSRWMFTLEANKKTDRTLARVAQAEADLDTLPTAQPAPFVPQEGGEVPFHLQNVFSAQSPPPPPASKQERRQAMLRALEQKSKKDAQKLEASQRVKVNVKFTEVSEQTIDEESEDFLREVELLHADSQSQAFEIEPVNTDHEDLAPEKPWYLDRTSWLQQALNISHAPFH